MNRAYRLIWNESLNIWVVAPEIASTRGRRSRVKRSAAILLLPLAISSHATLAADLAATALPGGGQVTAGQASISSSGANMAIDQGSQRAIINWQNFDIGSQASVTFRQPDASAVALNRVSGPTASRIEGQLTANGQVFLINPSGVLFGQGARVNVGGLVASTLNIRDQDFLTGNYVFTGSGGSITNQGQITAAPGGYLAFISPTITNSGAVSAPQGTVAMGAGERVRLNFAGDRLVGLDVSASTVDTLITNNHAIRAEGGAILLTAAGAEAVTRGVINNSGVLEASSLTSDGGRIVLTAGNDINLGAGSTVAVDGKKGGEITVQAQAGTLLADGNLSARGAEGKGGNVQLLGHQVGLVNAAQVDASGATGGGTVLVGGDYQGGNAAVQNAFRTYVGPQATIKADALQQGDGGKVIVWADETTRYFGNISADGAGAGGNGGFVETSGKETLIATGQVSARAPDGLAGTWLLDPNNITIQAAGSNTNVTASPNFTSTNDNAIVTTGSIQTALNAGTSVAVTTGSGGANSQPGNITVASAIAKTAGGNATLTLNAANNILFNTGANVTSTAGALGLTLNAGGTINTMRGISLNGGTLTLNAAGNVTQSSAITGNTSVVKIGAGTFTLSQNNTYTGATTINAGTLALGTNNVLADASSVVVNGGTFSIANRTDTVAGVQLLSGSITGTTGVLTSTSAYDLQSGTVSARLGGTAGLNKTTAGTVTLSGANTYTGATNINTGTLALDATGTIATSSGVANNGTFTTAAAKTIDSISGTGNTVLGGTLTIGDVSNTSSVYGGVISGAGGLTKAGAGTLTLLGANTYAGATTVSAGTLVAANAAALGATAAGTTVATDATLALQGGITVLNETLSLTGAGVGGNGAMRNLSSDNTWTGAVTLAGNTEIQSDAGTLTLSNANAVTGTNRTLTVDGAGNTMVSGIIATGTGTLTKNGTGTLTLSGANTYTGTTTINAGTLRYGANNVIAGGAVMVNAGGTYDLNNFSDTIGALAVNSGTTGGTVMTGSGTLTLGGNVTSTGGAANATISGNLALGAAARMFTTTNAADGLTVSATVTGAVGLTKAGAGTLTLSGVNTYTGTTTISAGTLTAAGGSAIADTSQVTLANTAGATLNLANSETIGNLSGGGATGGNVTLGANTLTVNETGTTTYSGVLSGTGGLTKAGTGTLTLGGVNTYTGATSINAGTLALNATGTIAASSGVANAGNFSIAAAKTIDSMTGAGTTALGANTLTIGDASNTSSTYTGVISGTGGGLIKAGTGTLTLSGTNTYTGTTTINAGTLVAANNTALGSTAGGTIVTNGATLALQGGVTIADALTLNGTGADGGGALRNLGGSNTSTGAITLASATRINSDTGLLTLSGAGNITGAQALTIGGAGDLAVSKTIATGAGTLSKDGTGTLTLSGANTYTGATAVNAGTFAVTANNALGTAAAGTMVASGATLDFRNVAYTTAEAVTLNGGTLAASTGTSSFVGPVTLGANSNIDVGGTQLTLSGAIGGAAGFGINKQGTGTLVLSGNNTYTGATNINAGTLTASGGSAIPDASQVNLANVAGAILNLATSETIGSLAGGGASGGNVTLGANTLTVNQGATTIYSGVISGSGGLTKAGTNSLTLAGANTYTGITNINAGALVAANATALGGTAGGTNVGASARLIVDGVALGAEPITLNGAGLFGSGAITSNGTASIAGPVTLAGDSIIAPNSGSTLTLTGPVDGAFGLTTGGLGTLALNGAVGGSTPLAFLTTGSNGATAIGASVRTTGNQTYNNPTTLGSGVVLQSTAGNLSAPGAVVATAGPVTLRAAGNVVFQNVANDFGTVAINAGANVAMRDANAIDLGATSVGGSLSLIAGGPVTDSGAISVAGATTINAGAANDITLDNLNDFAGNVSVQSGRNVRLNDINNLTLDLSSFGTLTATAAGTVTLAGQLTATGAGDAIVLSGSRFANSAGATALSVPAGSRWLVWSSNPDPFGGTTPDNRGGLAYDFKQYNATFGVTPVAQATGNGFLYAYAPTITPVLTGTVRKVYDGTTTATLAPSNFTPTSGVDGDVVAMSGTGTYDSANVAGSPTKRVTANDIAATVTSSVADGSKPVYGYRLTSTTASANIGEITPKGLTVASIADVSTTYGTPAATGAVSLNGVIGSDIVTSTAGIVSPTYSTSGNLNAGSYAQNASTLTGADAGNYTLTPFSTPTNNYTVGQLALTGTAIAASSSTYGSPLNPGAASFGNVIAGDLVTSTAGVNTATLSSSGNPVVGSYTQTAGALDGADAANYNLAGFTTPTANYTIDPLALTGGITASDKVYDGSTAATIASRTLSGVIGSDSVIYTGGTATFADKNAGVAKTVTATGLGLAGTDAGNYTVNTTATTTASITPAPLVITADDASRPVNTPNPQFTASYAGFVGGETPAVLNGVLAFSTPATLTSPVGTFPITPYGQSSGNYAITYVDGRLTIQGNPVVTLPAFPHEVVSQQAIGAQYTDPTMPTHALSSLHYTFVDYDDAKDEKVAASVVRVIGSGIRLPN